MACHVTSSSDFNKGDHVIHFEWTKALYDNCQPMLWIIVYEIQRSASDTPGYPNVVELPFIRRAIPP